MILRVPFAIAVMLAATCAVAQRGGRGDGEKRVELPPILKKAIQTNDDLKYAGTRSVDFLVEGQKRAHTQYVLRNGDFTRITFPDNSPFKGQVIVESRKQRRHFLPDKNEIFVGPPRREEALYRLFSYFKKDRGFQVAAQRGGEIAGQPTQIVIITDSKGNTVQRLWLDGNTAMILKRDFLDPTGTRVGGYEYTSIDYTPNYPSGAFQLERKGATIVTPVTIAKELARKNGMAAKFIPESNDYTLDQSRMLKIDGANVMQLIYQTGRGSVSLFQVRGNVDLSNLRRSKDYKVYTWQSGGYSYALVGHKDIKDFPRIAQSVR